MVKYYNENHKNKVEQYNTFKYNYSIKLKENGKYRIKVNVTHLYCNNELIIRLDSFNKYINKCKNCCGCYEKSFAYHIEIELGLNLDDIWNWEKNNENNINPYFISFGSDKEIWLYCLEYNCHNYNKEGDKIGYKTKPSRFCRGHRCGYCNHAKTHWEDSLAYNYPNIAKMIAITENDLTFDDCYNIACQSNKKFYFKCDKCNKISNNKKELSSVVLQNRYCEYCSDGISLPNKILRQISEQLNLDLEFEYSPIWLENKRLDGYDKHLKIAIEMDAEYKDNHKNKRKEVDNWKDKKCLEHEIYVIRVNLMDSKEYNCNTFNYIKMKILNSNLKYLYDLSILDWNLIWKNSQKSLCVETWELWKNGKSISEICQLLKLDRHTIRKYLKGGNDSNNIKYDVDSQKEKGKFKELTLYMIDLKNNKTKITLTELCKLLNISKDTYYNNIVKKGFIIYSSNFSKSKRSIISKYEGYKITKCS